jgi:hypothetical protein
VLVLAVAGMSVAWQPLAYAAGGAACADPAKLPAAQQAECQKADAAANQKSDITQYENCPNGQCLIDTYIQPAINMIAALVGIACVISFILAGIRYASSADNPQKVSESKQRMVTTAMVLIGFFTFYALLNYLIPGGLVAL